MKKWKSWDCHDCGVKEGQIHEVGCDMERCPICGGQFISCHCSQDEVEKVERIPYILAPNLCGLCGQQWPEMFSIPTSEWEKYVVPQLQRKLLCRECFDELKIIFPNGWKDKGESK